MAPRLSDDGSPVGVPHEHHIILQLVKCLTHSCRVGVEVAERLGVFAMPG